MPAEIGQGVTLRGLYSEDFAYTWNITNTAGVDPRIAITADGAEPAMVQDTTADNSARPSTDGAEILGALRTYENRKQEGLTVGTIYHKGNFVFMYTGTAPTRGQAVVGSATAGKVKAATAQNSRNTVVAVNTTNQTVVVMFG